MLGFKHYRKTIHASKASTNDDSQNSSTPKKTTKTTKERKSPKKTPPESGSSPETHVLSAQPPTVSLRPGFPYHLWQPLPHRGNGRPHRLVLVVALRSRRADVIVLCNAPGPNSIEIHVCPYVRRCSVFLADQNRKRRWSKNESRQDIKCQSRNVGFRMMYTKEGSNLESTWRVLLNRSAWMLTPDITSNKGATTPLL